MRFPNQGAHEAGDQPYLQVPRHLQEALSWDLASELVRRHPGELSVIEAHPHGIYDLLYVVREGREGNGLRINRGINTHVDVPVHIGLDEPRPNWLEMAVQEDRRVFLRALEMDLGLNSVTETPETTERSIGYRLIAEAISSRALTRRPLFARCGATDGDYGQGVVETLFSSALSLKRSESQASPAVVAGIPEFNFWFLVPGRMGMEIERCLDPDASPVLAVDCVRGLAWTSKGKVNLMKEYESCGRSMDRLLHKVGPLAS